jgi:hypothetical protein
VLPYGVAMVGNSVATVRLTWVLVVLGVWSGCGSAAVDTSPSGTSPSSAAVPTSVPTATELAESQITANTVTAPPTPSPCDPTDIEVVPVPATDATDADQVIGLINRGDVACEVDVSRSPDASENLEPNVVLGTDEVAHLWVSEVPACDSGQPDPATEFELRVNGASRLVPLTFAVRCRIELWAFFTD